VLPIPILLSLIQRQLTAQHELRKILPAWLLISVFPAGRAATEAVNRDYADRADAVIHVES
jgi:hypothetical protein